MVITKIEAGKYSIVTAGGLKFTVEKRRSHYWVVKGNGLGAVQATLKECKEWAEQQIEKPAEPVKPDTVTEADEPKSNVDRMMPDFLSGKIVFNAPTQELCDLFLDECVKRGLKWRSGELINRDYPHIWLIDGDSTCIDCLDGVVGYADREFYTLNYPSKHIVTLTPADFDKPKKEFTKADLKTGMVVECRNHTKYMVIEGKYECECGGDTDLMLIGEGNSWERGSYYSENLINNNFIDFSIDKVYKIKMRGLGSMLNNISDKDLIWQRKPEYDWSKAEVDMPILVKPETGNLWYKRYFAKYEDGIVFAWSKGCTSWTTDEISQWDCAMPYKGNGHLVEGEDK